MRRFQKKYICMIVVVAICVFTSILLLARGKTEKGKRQDIAVEDGSEDSGIGKAAEEAYKKLEKLFADLDNWDTYPDADGDGFPDEMEELIGSDKESEDTDGDGLNDYYEYIVLGTSPLFVDTDKNGISDDAEDFDDDGLTNKEEYTYSTIPWEEDTDEDGIIDGDEVLIYGVDPLNADSDRDGIADGDELPLGFDPANPDTDGNGIKDGDKVLEQTFVYEVENTECVVKQVIIETETKGSLEAATTVKSIMNIDVDCSNVVGLVGEPFEIETEAEYETATITFKVDISELNDVNFNDLLFLWYDEENGMFVELETHHNEGTGEVSTETTHFGKYMLVDINAWIAVWSKKIDDGIFENKGMSGKQVCLLSVKKFL